MRPRSLFIHVPSRRFKLNLSGIYPMPPLGIAMLAASLLKEGYPVELLDMPGQGYGEKELLDFLRERSFDHIGLSVNYLSIAAALELAGRIKEIRPEALLSLGGPGTLFGPEKIVGYTSALDLIAAGEGEDIVVEIARALEEKREPRGIPGTAFIEEGKIEITSPSSPLVMDSLPRPALDLLPLDNYRIHPPFGAYPPVMIVETSRGCEYRCTFCSIPRQLRAQSPDTVVELVRDLVDRYRIREVHFVDPNFTFDRERALTICEGLKRETPELHWTCKTRCDMVDGELLAMMASSGCYTISYGVESATDAILETLRKDMRAAQIEECLRETKRAGIRTLAYMLVGAPGESDESVGEMMALMRRTGADYVLYSELFADPHSKLTEEAIGKGLFSEKEMLDCFIGGRDELFQNRTLLGHPKERINGWIKKASNDFYARPVYLYKRLRTVRSLPDLLNLFRGAWHLLADKLGLSKTAG